MQEQQKPMLQMMEAWLAHQQKSQEAASSRQGQNSGLGSCPVGQWSYDALTLGKLSATDDIDDFLDSFDRIAHSAGWPEEQWAIRLAASLMGEALSAYRAMPTALANDYTEVTKAIRDRLGLTPLVYNRMLRATHLKIGEIPKALGHRLRSLAAKWLRPEEKTVDTLMDVIVLE